MPKETIPQWKNSNHTCTHIARKKLIRQGRTPMLVTCTNITRVMANFHVIKPLDGEKREQEISLIKYTYVCGIDPYI